MPDLVRYTSPGGEWSALYLDGKLVQSGDHYLVDEKISQIAGVKEIHSDDFLQGGNYTHDVAKTLDELEAYTVRLRVAEAAAAAEAAQLDAEEAIRRAAELEAQAQALRAAAQK